MYQNISKYAKSKQLTIDKNSSLKTDRPTQTLSSKYIIQPSAALRFCLSHLNEPKFDHHLSNGINLVFF